ncbi:MAG TPA: Do family serine endopeptidase [Steroidobacteraceae bacterium]|nr:Do family serine endopeptidase [Steroidobacteraceae bacterium]
MSAGFILKAMLRIPGVSFFIIALVVIGAQAARAQPQTDARGLPTLAPLVNEVTPAVVNISVITRSPLETNPLFADPFFRRFFSLPDQPQRQEQAAGSGVIVDAARGYVITNHHVIRNAEQVLVTLKDRRQLPAKLIGTDPGTDIAVLQIDAKGLSAIRFGDSDTLQVGDYVIAIGNPFGIGQTVTSGIVSALGRSGLSPEGFEDFIQTDASINPGNSGGALINLRGELVGINSAILGPTGGNVGIGFAVPSNMARAVLTQIARFGEVRRGRLGISMVDLTPDIAKKLGVGATEGVVITVVQAGSPAEKAGLRERDVVVALGSHPVRAASELRARLGLTPVGEEIELRVLRGKETRSIRTTIAPPQEAASTEGKAVQQLPGMSVVEIERGSLLYRQLKGGGLVVADVEEGSRARMAGFRPADIIYAVNRRRVQTLAEFQKAVGAAKGGYSVSLLRGDFNVTIIVR